MSKLGHSINGLVTGRNTELCCRGFVLALLQSNIAFKIDSECTRDYLKLFLLCKVDILQVTVNKIEVLSSFRLISDEFWLKVQKIAKKIPFFLADVHKGDKLSTNITIQF